MNLTRKKRSRLKVLPLILIISMFLLFTGCQKKPATQPEQPGQTTATEQATTASTEQPTEASEATTLISLPTEAPDSTSTDAASQDTSQKAATAETSDKAATSLNAAQAVSTDVTSSNATQATSTTDAKGSDGSKAASTTDATSTATSQLSSATAEKSDKSSASEAASQSPSDLIPEDGTYTTKEDVALYIHTYGKLPQNFITKKAAKKLGWQGGSLEDYAPGKCIGGDYFGNYEGLLPEDKEYHECDIGTLGKSKRGAKRIIYSDDGYIYYTGDHYESFELLYEP
ncbi:ribonuclease domain-containing protein [Butyrivibrio sp. VCB2001]|uniref:ribonuclease domain-containing protein n=1 Tax=Butyrivibrio sp. VCB2001 TaxID=1280667 RepID=UPI000412398C|nr:ribonuclease domain-containing protein [Butyrivibrio sp. VCB2001]